MDIETTRFGPITLTDNVKVFSFGEGLLGFSDRQQFVILDNPSGGVFQWLQSTEQSDLAFVICDPSVFKADYNVPVSKADLARLGADSIENVQVRVIITVTDNPEDMTANLQGPLLFSAGALIARQLILADEIGYSTQHRVIPESSGAGSVTKG